MVHELLIPAKFYSNILTSRMTFYIISVSIPFKVGDSCLFYCKNPPVKSVNSSPIVTKVTFVAPLCEVFSIDSDIVVFSFKII